MTRQGRRWRTTGALALALACALPAPAWAFDSAVQPVTLAAAAVPTLAQPPVASGSAVRGSDVSVAPGAWTGAPAGYTFVWQREQPSGFATISGAVASTYRLTGSDVGVKVRALVTARNSVGPGMPAESNELGPVAAAPPANVTAPTITGTPRRGSVLKADAGTWTGVANTYLYQWQRDTGSDVTDIAGATTATYTLAPADKDAQVRVRVTAVNADGRDPAYSAELGPIAASPPLNSTVPAVSGTPLRGMTLTTNAGTWSGVGNTYSYQWQRKTGSGFTDIAGATKPTYVLVAADTGAAVRSTITATNPDGALTVFSVDVAVAGAKPANTAVPAIAGTAKRANVLTAAIGTWTGAGNTYAYQWQRESDSGFADIEGATSASYTLATADLDARIEVKVTATNVDGTATAFSAPTAIVETSRPVQGAAPVASGTTRTGASVTTTNGTWTPAGSTFAYQWQRETGPGFTDIPGATASSYALTDAEVGARVRAKVTAANSDGTTDGYSNAIGPVLPTPVNTLAPTVDGELTDASTLTAVAGEWASADQLNHTYRYQWVRCPPGASTANSTGCMVLPGATNRTYLTVAADVGSVIGVRVTATNTLSVSAAAPSAVTDAITGRALDNVDPPQITGTPTVGSLQTTSEGTWSVPLIRTTYQWRRCTLDGLGCADIAGAIAKTYAPVVADVGRALVVQVGASSPGRTASAVSALSAQILAQPLPTAVSPVTISGVPSRMQLLRAVMATWKESPTAFGYQWQRCDAVGDFCAAIPGATTAGYVVAKADEGSKIRVTQTGSNTGGTSTTTSDPTAVIAAAPPVPGATPIVSGSGLVGTTLSATRGGWSATPDTTYAYSWRRCDAGGGNCVGIGGAVASTYRPVDADVDATLRAVVTASNADGSVPSASAPSVIVKPAPPAANPGPVLSGTATVGRTVTATTGIWTGISQTVKTTFWRCGATCAPIVTGVSRTYTLTPADAGFRIRASVTGVGPGGTTQVYAAALLGPVRSATAASALAAAAPVSLKSATGVVLATATASVPKAGGEATASVTRAKSLKGRYRAWACPEAGELEPCTKPVALTGRAARVKLAVDAGERVRVVVAKSGK